MKNASLTLVVIFGSLLASSCATPEERALLTAEQEAAARAREDANLQTAKHRCSEYGYTIGTELFARCMQDEANAERARYEQAEMPKQEALREAQRAIAAKATRDQAEADRRRREIEQ